MGHFATWCESIRREEQAFDPWAAKREPEDLIDAGEWDDEDDSLFSVERQQSIAHALLALQSTVEQRLGETGQDVAELKLYVPRQFEYLRRDLATTGRSTWRTIFRDFMVNIASTLTMQLGTGGTRDLVVIANESIRAISG